jgi:hypothetical protein
MSSDYLKLVPADSNFVPDEAAQKRAVAAFEELLPEGSECEAQHFAHVTFIDQGENLEAIICPACSKRLQLYDGPDAESNQDWWYRVIEKLEDGNAEGVNVSLPCCSRPVPLTAVRFDWPAAFARFELSILDPGIGENLSREQLVQFEKILGCDLIQVRAHY